jgi:hypothetical protein
MVDDATETMICCTDCLIKSQKKKPRHKFLAKPCDCDGIKFASKLEAGYYQRLKRLKESGEVLFFLMQVPFILPGNIRYRCDFQIFWADGRVSFVDTKAFETAVSMNKIKQVEALYGVDIEIYSGK